MEGEKKKKERIKGKDGGTLDKGNLTRLQLVTQGLSSSSGISKKVFPEVVELVEGRREQIGKRALLTYLEGWRKIWEDWRRG